jgi:filamentous hemagglutinin
VDLGKYTGPVVVVDKEDHPQTGSWGSSEDAQKYRNDEVALIEEGKFLDAVLMGARDLLDIAEAVGDAHKYDRAIIDILRYFGSLDPATYAVPDE